ncbi:MAG: GNAT family N-acetyltransferase [Acetobacteraceae bacterium]|nr:GNAT family N-acetyltransferase [Acetobacteraceae bacterium]MSP30690.1 GNAT family N-acetyltransferase [Acetobacteraceae bacterium]
MSETPRSKLANPRPAVLTVERVTEFTGDDLNALCEATAAAILEGGGFGWVNAPERQVLERYFRGLLLVPERELFIGRLDGLIVGSAQLVRPPRNNEAQSFAATLMHLFIAPFARGHGVGRMMVQRVEDGARALGYQVLNLDVRETQTAAIRMYEALGYVRWGEHPAYARVSGQIVRGIYYYKQLRPMAAKRETPKP